MSLVFGQPLALLLLLLLPLVWLISRVRNRLRLKRINYRLSLVLRSLMLTSLVLALAETQFYKATDRQAVVFLVDGSDSMGGSTKGQAMQFVRQAMSVMPDSQVNGVVVFGQHAFVEKLLDSKRDLPDAKAQPGGAYTNLAEAVRLGVALLPNDMQRRLVLISDGNQNLDDVRAAAQVAANHGVQIDVLPLAAQDGPEVSIGSISAPGGIRENEQFDLTVTVNSNYAGKGRLQILQDGKIVSDEPIDYVIGFNQFRQSVKAEKQGMLSYTARLVGEKDTIAQNNVANNLVFVREKPKTLLIEGHPDQNEAESLSAALRSGGIELTVAPPDKFPEAAQLSNFDSVVLFNTPASSLPKNALETLQAYVRDLGRGLLVVGGEESYGLGGYFRTPLEDMLPVSLQLPSRVEQARVAMVLVVDRSGSMSETYLAPNSSARVTKMEMAKDAAYLAATQLGNSDLLGIVTFDTVAQWQVNIAPLSATANDLQATVGRIKPGGGTSIVSGLKTGVDGLKSVRAQAKHIVLLTDGQDRENSQYDQIIEDANRSNITVSTIGLGWDVNQSLLQRIATQGGGQYSFADDPNNLPKIFLRETRLAARNYIVEEPFVPRLSGSSPIMRGIEEAPQLLGYVGTKAKPTATTVLVTARQDPLLAQWQYGLGRVVAWTSDAKPRWSKDWLNWSNFSRFWTQAVRWTVPASDTSGLEVRAVSQGDQVMVEADALGPDQQFLNGLDTIVTVASLEQGGTPKEVRLKQTAPGHYQGFFTSDDKNNNGYTMTVKASTKTTPGSPEEKAAVQRLQGDQLRLTRTLGLPPAYSAEYKLLGINTLLLQDIARLTGGKVLNSQNSAEAFRPGLELALQPYSLVPWLLVFAIALWPFDIALRHLNPSYVRRKRKPVIGS